MRLDELPFKGRFEEQMPPVLEQPLQVVVPENDLDQELLCWAIMPHPETLEDSSAGEATVFEYRPGGHRGNGLFTLTITCRRGGVSHEAWTVELARAMIAGVSGYMTGRSRSFAPFWIMDRRLHWKASKQSIDDRMGGPACGRLDFTGTQNLPHRRLLSPADVGAAI